MFVITRLGNNTDKNLAGFIESVLLSVPLILFLPEFDSAKLIKHSKEKKQLYLLFWIPKPWCGSLVALAVLTNRQSLGL